MHRQQFHQSERQTGVGGVEERGVLMRHWHAFESLQIGDYTGQLDGLFGLRRPRLRLRLLQQEMLPRFSAGINLAE